MATFEKENDELLESLETDEEANQNGNADPNIPKIGTKSHIISRIREVCQKGNILLEETETVLKRKSKHELKLLLALYIERVMERQIHEKLKMQVPQGCVDSQEKDKLVAVSMLRMLHDSCCKTLEYGVQNYSPYTIQGFCANLKEENVSAEINKCLLEIAEEQDILQYVTSPYARLGICWASAVMTTVRKKTVNNKPRIIKNNGLSGSMESKTNDRIKPVRR